MLTRIAQVDSVSYWFYAAACRPCYAVEVMPLVQSGQMSQLETRASDHVRPLDVTWHVPKSPFERETVPFFSAHVSRK